MKKRIWKGGTLIYPLPAVIVSMGNFANSLDQNLITIAWTGIINTNPPKTYISLRPSRHSYEIIKKYKEFVINLTTENMAYATDFCGVKSGRDIDKFKEAKLSPIKSEQVNAPSIDESPLSLECKVFEILELGSHHMFMADIVSVSADELYFDKNDVFNFHKSKPICYSHGAYYKLGEKLGKFGFSVQKNKRKNSKKRKYL